LEAGTTPVLVASSPLARLLDEPLVVVDVGARWGASQAWDALGDRCLTIGFEPDEAECERLNLLHAGQENLRFVPLALGPRPGLSPLHLTRGRGASSIYRPSGDVMRRHPALAAILPVEETTVIEMTTLDSWCASEGIGRVDAIKVDTQGSELGVLEGASRTLETVRAVEVEVEFNELYTGAPLFGDVDRFLRERGFLLWKLRDLAHYPQTGAPAGWTTPDASYYDTHVAWFRSRVGQVFWANAFYLKKETARPSPASCWSRLVRDACVTGAHGFFDLSLLALELARAHAPEQARPLVDAALAEHAEQRGRCQAAPLSCVVEPVTIPLAETGFTGAGWLPAETVGSGLARWTGPGRDAWLDLPAVVLPGTRVDLLVAATTTPEIAEGLAVEVNRTPLLLDRTPHEHGIIYSGTLPAGYTSPRRFTRLMVRTPAVGPHPQPGADAGETEVGAAVAWIRLTPPCAP
jgi:FkbM family methyltransferase